MNQSNVSTQLGDATPVEGQSPKVLIDLSTQSSMQAIAEVVANVINNDIPEILSRDYNLQGGILGLAVLLKTSEKKIIHSLVNGVTSSTYTVETHLIRSKIITNLKHLLSSMRRQIASLVIVVSPAIAGVRVTQSS
jgi:hypothetical protein